MSTVKKSKKTPKPPNGRPVSTAQISHPTVEDASSLFALTSFSMKGDLFAYVSLAVDKHRLRVYNTTTGQAVADHIIDTTRVSSMVWSALVLGDSSQAKSDEKQTAKKKRKKRDNTTDIDTKTKTAEVVVLGCADGTITCFSPSHGRVLRSLSHASSTSAILALAVENGTFIWASSADSVLRLWDVNQNELVGSWKADDRASYTSLTLRPVDEEDRTEILAANHTIRLISRSTESGVLPKKLQQLTTFTGHASPIKSLKWILSDAVPTRFISRAESDRFLYIWEIPGSSDTDGKPVASVPLDSDARSFSLSRTLDSTVQPVLLTLSASGKISLYPVPQEISPTTGKTLSTLLPKSNIIANKKSSLAHVIDAAFVEGAQGKILVARLVQGVRPVFTVVRYLDEAGHFTDDIELEDVSDTVLDDTRTIIPNKRYTESSIAIVSGIEIGHDENMDEVPLRDIDGDLEVDLAELSLGQRLAAVSGVEQRQIESDNEADAVSKKGPSTKRIKPTLDVVPASSLTRTLIQALHSSDARLLETCLAHSNFDLIRNTVRKLPPQLAIALLNACVERLSRGARAGNMKGGGGGASAQRGMTLVTWIRTVLAVHTGHLMTVPDLVARLSGLHATLTARLALQESLLSLSGRLDMVLSQIEMRSSIAAPPLAPKTGKMIPEKQKKVKHYIEGESESSEEEDEGEQMDVEVEAGDEEGSVEDVELGGSEDEQEEGKEEEEEDEDEDEDEDEEYNGSEDGDSGEEGIEGFIDDEAEEYSEDEDDETE